jgi:hypothetical protein
MPTLVIVGLAVVLAFAVGVLAPIAIKHKRAVDSKKGYKSTAGNNKADNDNPPEPKKLAPKVSEIKVVESKSEHDEEEGSEDSSSRPLNLLKVAVGIFGLLLAGGIVWWYVHGSPGKSLVASSPPAASACNRSEIITLGSTPTLVNKNGDCSVNFIWPPSMSACIYQRTPWSNTPYGPYGNCPNAKHDETPPKDVEYVWSAGAPIKIKYVLLPRYTNK